MKIGWDLLIMNTNGNNLSITVFNNQLPYIPTELWDKINMYVYLMEIQDQMKVKEETWKYTNNFIKELGRRGTWEMDMDCDSLYNYLSSYGHHLYSEDLPMKLYKDYFTIYSKFGWDFGQLGGIGSYVELMELRDLESHNRMVAGVSRKALCLLTPESMDITEEILEGEEVEY